MALKVQACPVQSMQNSVASDLVCFHLLSFGLSSFEVGWMRPQSTCIHETFQVYFLSYVRVHLQFCQIYARELKRQSSS